MARGRFISNCIVMDKAVNDLSDDTSRLAFTWLITFTDREGKTSGDPTMLLSTLFPRRRDISIDKMESYIQEWCEKDFIILYNDETGERFIKFNNFDKHQKGLRKNREKPSEIPEPENCKIINTNTNNKKKINVNSGKAPDEVRTNSGKHDADTNNKKSSAAPLHIEGGIYGAYEREIGPLSPFIKDKIGAWVKDLPTYAIEMAIKEAAKHNKRSLAYVEAIMKRWLREGVPAFENGNTPSKTESKKQTNLSEWSKA